MVIEKCNLESIKTMIEELNFSVECKKRTDLYQIAGIYPTPKKSLPEDMINRLIEGKEFHRIEEIQQYIVHEPQGEGIIIGKNIVREMSE